MPSQIAADIESIKADPASGRWLMWTRTDARDAADACRQAVEVAELETGVYNITGARIVLDADVRDLLGEHFETTVEIRDDQNAVLSPLSCEKARKAFGYEPRYVWTESEYHDA